MEYTSNQLEDAFEKASPKIKEILSSSWITEEVGQIGNDFSLRIDRINILVKSVGLVLLNIIALPNFVKYLEEELSLDKDSAIKLAKAIDNDVFERVRDIVKKDDSVIEFKDKEIESTRLAVEQIIDAVDKGDMENMSFKDKLNNTKVHKIEKRIFDPYREIVE